MYNYFYRYRQIRKNIKDIVDTNNFVGAQTQLNNIIAEFETKFPDSDTRRDYNFGEKIMMVHAKNHLNVVIDKNDPSFINEDGTTGHHSDIVKEGLLRAPKTDYSID